MGDCSLSTPWVADDFTPCFREAIVDSLIPIALLSWSIVAVGWAYVRNRRASSSIYMPLKSNAPGYTSYGAANIPQQQSDDNDSGDDTSSSSDRTLTPAYEESAARWTTYNVSRVIVSAVQLGVYLNALSLVLGNNYDIDPSVEGTSSDLTLALGGNTIFWAIALLLAGVNIILSGSSKRPVASEICKQLNFLYTAHFLINCIDLRSFYVQHYTDIVSPGYVRAITTACITFALLVIVINEARHTPRQTVIADTGRVMSGENWASIYSQYFFCWVHDMMKEGYRRTLNEDDLYELVPENRAKSILASYRSNKSHSLLWGIFKTFKQPLIAQFLYCSVWNIGMFGPPLFLNKIVKYIENPNSTEPASTAFVYVLLLFITGAVQTLAVQQALYIGRTLGIRIQAIVIGEVFSKSLRRRDNSSSMKEEDGPKKEEDDQKDDTKANVNNLLSVDAQKLGEFIAYIFYVYSYPIQIVVSIACLYQLLGVAALWGVLVMILTQPATFFIGRRFQTAQRAVMSATDNRLKMVNELLSAIRIVKFFAWEKEFRKRVLDARDVELKAIRARLFMFMHMLNAWFMIPILIMVTVFYVYTRTYELTASTAFTALALFNTFRAALDEFPMLISQILQANVSAKRIDNFLDEDEVDIHATDAEAAADGVQIGFVGNATFSWDKPELGNNAYEKASIKDLNLSFPRNKLSIVCGPTGSGKTTLLASLLGETYTVCGSARLTRTIPNRHSPLGGAVSGVAYVAQTAWLQNCSIRDNILFGLPYDEDRYLQVLYMTALTKDLEILEFGDSTEVGEKGITLSGGQKQRVAIARAVYSQADTVVLDDCLSAVDAHTAKHLYEHCITGDLMRGRTIILVTHHVGLCIKGASYVVALKDGRVAGAGEPQAVMRSGVLGEELARVSEELAEAEECAATDGPVPVVPKTLKKSQPDGTGKLTQEEVRAEGGVTWSVYETYIRASGGYMFWVLVMFLFCLAQATVLGQDYWIKIWAGAYAESHHNNDDANGTTTVGSFGMVHLASGEPGAFSIQYIQSYNNNAPLLDSQQRDQIDIKYYLGVYFLIGLIALVVTSARSLILFTGSIRASRRLHEQLLNRILRAKVRFFDSTPLGRIVNRFSSDMGTVDQDISPLLSFLVYSIVATLCVVILISTVIPGFIIPGILIAAMYWFIGVYYLATSRDMKRLNSVSRSPIYVQFNESVNGVVTIRAFGAQFRFLAENHKRIDNNNRPFLWMWATNRWLHARVEVLGAFVGFVTGLVLIMSRGWVDAGLAGLCLSYSLTFTHHVLWVVRTYAMNEMNMNAIERVHEYLDIEEEPPVHIPATCPPHSWPETGAIQVRDLEMRYTSDGPAVLRNISFETRPREKVGIVGRTGSGKSTLTLSLFRFMEPSAGQIIVDGVDIGKIGLEDLRSRLTIIPQDPVLFSGTLRTNLDPFSQHDDAELWAALKQSHLIDNASEEQQITLDSPVLENGSNWSQGQRQLIALARALVKRSKLIILDEATSSVDFDTDHQIQQTIRAEFGESSLLCIAHRIRTVADYDRILVLDQGQIMEFDTPYNLMHRDNGIFKQMCERSGEFNELLAIATSKHLKTANTH